MNLCPCGKEKEFEQCCSVIIQDQARAQTAEDLMRARYSAYATGNIDFVMQSHLERDGESQDRETLESWSRESDWLGLEVISTQKGQAADQRGIVEFCAKYKIDGQEQTHHERAEFEKVDGVWFFADGKPVTAQFVRNSPKVGRNDPCSCGSGKKHKKCCGRA
jgi:SEC-C motif-containing protein